MLADRSTMNLDLTGRWVQEGYNNSTLAGRSAVIIFVWPAGTRWIQHISAGRSAVIIFVWPAGTRWVQYMSDDRAVSNLHLTGWSVQEGYNNSTLASRSAVIISFLASQY